MPQERKGFQATRDELDISPRLNENSTSPNSIFAVDSLTISKLKRREALFSLGQRSNEEESLLTMRQRAVNREIMIPYWSMDMECFCQRELHPYQAEVL